MKAILIIIMLMFFSAPLGAQWTSFELDNIDIEKFQQQTEPFLKTISLSTNRHFFSPNIIINRISIGVSYSRGINITGEKHSTDIMGDIQI